MFNNSTTNRDNGVWCRLGYIRLISNMSRLWSSTLTAILDAVSLTVRTLIRRTMSQIIMAVYRWPQSEPFTRFVLLSSLYQCTSTHFHGGHPPQYALRFISLRCRHITFCASFWRSNDELSLLNWLLIIYRLSQEKFVSFDWASNVKLLNSRLNLWG